MVHQVQAHGPPINAILQASTCKFGNIDTKVLKLMVKIGFSLTGTCRRILRPESVPLGERSWEPRTQAVPLGSTVALFSILLRLECAWSLN